MSTAYIALGSNLADPRRQVCAAFEALARLPDTRLLARSDLYRSTPMGPADQPDYINAVARLETALAPLELLDALQAIEQQQGRVRHGERWGPRTLDLDLLLFADTIIEEPRLTVPHPGLAQRNFVLTPLMDIADKALIIPGQGTLAELQARCRADGLERLGPC